MYVVREWRAFRKSYKALSGRPVAGPLNLIRVNSIGISQFFEIRSGIIITGRIKFQDES
jgi:hypothetical protein